MKFGCLAVDCLDDLEIKELCDFLFKNGYFRFGSNEGYSLIAIDIDGTFYDLPSSDIVRKERKRITYQQFMEKYAMIDLKSKVEEAKKTLGLNNHELSLKLGHQKRYITNALLDPSLKRQKNIILKINALLLKESGGLNHDFEGKALNKKIDDALMVPKSEYESMKKEIDHKTQIAEKHADMRNKAELRVSELEILAKDLNHSCDEWKKLFWCVKVDNMELTNSKRAISICLAVSILIIVAMLAFGVLHFNGVV